jgi:23S rRNA (guanosine2251-2'-O)-methyltransferase
MAACYTLCVNRGARGTERHRKVSRSERLAFGVHAVEEALRVGEVERLVLLEGNNEGASSIESFALRRGVPIVRVPEHHMVSLVGKVAHQGVVAQVRPFEHAPASALLGAEGPLVVCCGIEDPGNLGAVLRVAAGLGAGGVFVSDVGSVRVTASVRKGAAGCLHKVPLARGSVLEFLKLAKEAHRTVFAAVPTGGADPAAVRPQGDTGPVLVVGSEGRGIPAEILALADERLTIPLERDVESLNVAVAVALLLWWASGR